MTLTSLTSIDILHEHMFAHEDNFSRRALQRLRKGRKFSQEGLARRSGLSTVTVAKLEEGRSIDPRASTLGKLAKGLGCSVDKLFETTAAGSRR